MDSQFILTIYPDQADYHANAEQLTSLLKELKLVGQLISKNRYSTGESFLSLLTFMGCSPSIELDPQDDKPYCYIETKVYKQMLFVSGVNTKYPPCPKCKAKLHKLTCSTCKKDIDPTKPNWRKSAFTASCWIIIGNIYELEAIPNDQLINALENETGVKWKYAYIRQALKTSL